MKVIEETIGIADDGEAFWVGITESGEVLLFSASQIAELEEIAKIKEGIEDKLSKKFGYKVYLDL